MSDRFPLGFWLLTLAARGLGAAKEVLLAMVLGTSPWKDALVVAWTAPALVASYCNETLPALLTPLWTQPGSRGSRPIRRLIAAIVGLQLGLALLAGLWPAALIGCVAPGLRGANLALAVELERWLALNILLLGAQTLATAWLNARRQFSWTPSGTGVAATAVIVTVLFTRGWVLSRRIVWIAVAITAGNVLCLLALLGPVLWPWLGLRPRHQPRPTSARAPAPAALWRSMGALLLAMLILNLVPLAERMATSRLPAGSLAAYDYGERLVQLVFSLSVAPFTAVSFTRLAELAPAAGAAFARQFETALRGLLTLMLPLAVGLAVFAPLCTRCVYGWGRFNASSLAATAPVVAIKGAGLGLDAAFYFLVFTIFARGEARAKLPIALVLAAANLPLAFWFAGRWGVAGLAAAHVMSYGGALAWIAARRRVYLPGLRCRGAIAAGAKAGVITLLAASVAHALLPGAVLAGQGGGLASWGWALAALALTAAGAVAGAAGWAPDLLEGLRRALWPRPLARGEAA